MESGPASEERHLIRGQPSMPLLAELIAFYVAVTITISLLRSRSLLRSLPAAAQTYLLIERSTDRSLER
jgi:hypothetical protein